MAAFDEIVGDRSEPTNKHRLPSLFLDAKKVSPGCNVEEAISGPVIVGVPVDYRDRLMEDLHPKALN